jgi:integrase
LAISSTSVDPGLRVKQPKTGGHVTWSEEHIAAFRNAYPVGTKPRLAMELLLGTALRCADVVKLGRGHVHDGLISITKVIPPAELAKVVSITAQKTNTALTIPITAELAEAINAGASSEHVTFLINERGRSFSAKKFGEWFTEQCRRAGINGVSAHGLRKGACRRLAEAGCTAPEIAAISGHKSLAEVQRYIAAANRKKLARNAMAKVGVRG